MMIGIQNGLISLGAFIALSNHVNGWLVFLFCALFWDYNKTECK